MKTPSFRFFKKTENVKPRLENPKPGAPDPAKDLLFEAMPSWWVVLLAYLLALIFCFFVHQFFHWFPPYLREIFKNLRGLPVSWADQVLFWGERVLSLVAVAGAVYHNLWQIGTRYRLTSHDMQIENWFPVRKVKAVPYGSIRYVGYQQSLLGLAFKYGHIEIETGSTTGLLVLVNCPHPGDFIRTLQSKVEAVLQPHSSQHR
jgi:membrane protein YdbS with pleckstrin-like domain